MKRTETDHVDLESVIGLSTVLREVSRYDLVLGVIPLSLLTATVGASVTSASLEVSVGASSLVCLLAMVDALFLNPPSVGGDAEDRGSGRSRRPGPK